MLFLADPERKGHLSPGCSAILSVTCKLSSRAKPPICHFIQVTLLMCRQFLARFSSPPGREQCFSQLSPGIQQHWPGSSLAPAAQLPLSLAGLTVWQATTMGQRLLLQLPVHLPVLGGRELCVGSAYRVTVPQLSPSVCGTLERCHLSPGISLDQCKPVRGQGIY